MSMYITLLLCFVITGLVFFLARETKLRMALQSLCNRLLERVAELSPVSSRHPRGHHDRPFKQVRRRHRPRTHASPHSNSQTPRSH